MIFEHSPIFSIYKVRAVSHVRSSFLRRPYPYYSIGHVRVKSGERYSGAAVGGHYILRT